MSASFYIIMKVFLSFWLIVGTQVLFAQSVDFVQGDASIFFDTEHKLVKGEILYHFTCSEKNTIVGIDAKEMQIDRVEVNGKSVEYLYNQQIISFSSEVKIGANTVKISYQTSPKQALYFVDNEGSPQIWTQGQGKYTSHWLPSFDDTSEKVIFNLNIRFDKNFQVISNGKLVDKTCDTSDCTWYYQMQQPMSSYLVMLAIGNYQKKVEYSKSGVPIENYLPHNAHQHYTYTYQNTPIIMDILEEFLQVPYPWKVYRNIPVYDFMYAGMENTTATTFHQNFVVDKIGAIDRSYLNVDAHEMAHHWFGNLITAKHPEDHWIQEGFATYLDWYIEKQLKGDDYYYWKMYEMNEKVSLDAKVNKNTVIYSPKATTTTYYDKAALAVYNLSLQLGEEKFRQVLKLFLQKHAFRSVTTEDFLQEIKNVSPTFDVETFKNNWLYNSGLPIDLIQIAKENSQWVTTYLQVIELQKLSFKEKKELLWNYLTDETNGIYTQKEVIYQLHKENFEDIKAFYHYVAQSKNVKLRQALVQIIQEIPDEFYEEYVKFLQDDSYITKELVFKNLWLQKPENRIQLLDDTQDIIGMGDKNFRISWLMMALKTEYKQNEKAKWYKELHDYTTERYNADVRQNAIQALWYVNPLDKNALPPLIDGLVHHNTRFVNFCRKAIKQLCERKEFKVYFAQQLEVLSVEKRAKLEKIIGLE